MRQGGVHCFSSQEKLVSGILIANSCIGGNYQHLVQVFQGWGSYHIVLWGWCF